MKKWETKQLCITTLLLSVIGHCRAEAALSWWSTKLLKWNLPSWIVECLNQPEALVTGLVAICFIALITTITTWYLSQKLAQARKELARLQERYDQLQLQILTSSLSLIAQQNKACGKACSQEQIPRKQR